MPRGMELGTLLPPWWGCKLAKPFSKAVWWDLMNVGMLPITCESLSYMYTLGEFSHRFIKG